MSSATDPGVAAALSCVTSPWQPPDGVDDLLSLLPAPTGGLAFVTETGSSGDGLVGWGSCASIRVSGPDAAAQISGWFNAQVSAMRYDDRVELPGSGPVCFVSLGFAPRDVSVAVIPRVAVGRHDGNLFMTTITASGHDPAAELGPVFPLTDSGQVRYSDSELSTADFMAAVEVAVARIKAGAAAKVVLAHGLTAMTEFPVDERVLLRRLAARYPSCATYAVDGLVGASPEMLMRRRGRQISSRVLAGTAWPEGSVGAGAVDGAAADAVSGVGADAGAVDANIGMRRVAADLKASAKDLAEHRFAVDSVADVLGPRTTRLEVPSAPSELELANLTHLATDITGELAGFEGAGSTGARDGAGASATGLPTALDLAALLHPTAAVGGTPTRVALDMIAELERASRGRYAAPVGWLDTRGDGDFAIALRCASVSGHSVTMMAGCGIVEGSDPAVEAREAQIKMLPIRDALEQ